MDELPPALLELTGPLELLGLASPVELLELTSPLELLSALLELVGPLELIVMLGVLGKLRDLDVGTVMTMIMATSTSDMPATIAPCTATDWLRTCVRVRLVSIFHAWIPRRKLPTTFEKEKEF